MPHAAAAAPLTNPHDMMMICPRSPAVKEWEKSYQPPVIHLGRVLSVGDGIARVYGLKSVQVRSGKGMAGVSYESQ